MSTVVLRQTAAWNPKLTNPYRTRWTEAAGRYFEVYSDRLDGIWCIHEIDADGTWLGPEAFGAIAFTLTEARTLIAAETDQP